MKDQKSVESDGRDIFRDALKNSLFQVKSTTNGDEDVLLHLLTSDVSSSSCPSFFRSSPFSSLDFLRRYPYPLRWQLHSAISFRRASQIPQNILTLKILVIVLEHEFCCLFIECRLRKWLDKKTADDHQHVTNPWEGCQSFLCSHIFHHSLDDARMKNLCKKKPCLLNNMILCQCWPARKS